jgi:hypothetical protein
MAPGGVDLVTGGRINQGEVATSPPFAAESKRSQDAG